MKKILLLLFAFTLIFSCNESASKKKDSVYKRTKKSEKKNDKSEGVKASEIVDLENKGVGPVKSVTLPKAINEEMVKQGQELFASMCVACHKVGSKFIGPAPNGILKKRTPEWVMNMMLAPEKMLAEDPLAKKLLKEFNNTPMINQNLTEEQARAILEYFRTLE